MGFCSLWLGASLSVPSISGITFYRPRVAVAGLDVTLWLSQSVTKTQRSHLEASNAGRAQKQRCKLLKLKLTDLFRWPPGGTTTEKLIKMSRKLAVMSVVMLAVVLYSRPANCPPPMKYLRLWAPHRQIQDLEMKDDTNQNVVLF